MALPARTQEKRRRPKAGRPAEKRCLGRGGNRPPTRRTGRFCGFCHGKTPQIPQRKIVYCTESVGLEEREAKKSAFLPLDVLY